MSLVRILPVVPAIGIFIGPLVHNEVHPLIFGMPFPLGWVTVWVVIIAITMGIVYSIDPANKSENEP